MPLPTGCSGPVGPRQHCFGRGGVLHAEARRQVLEYLRRLKRELGVFTQNVKVLGSYRTADTR